MTYIKEKFLITGVSGFIGTNLALAFNKMKVDYLGIDRNYPKASCQSQVNFHKCDLLDISALCEVIKSYQPTRVIHLAARTDLDGKTIEDYIDNTNAVRNLCHVASTANSIEHIIFASSMLVCNAGYIPSSDHDYCPSTLYGESKVIGETIVNDLKASLPPYVIVRPTSIWGPWFEAPYRNFFDMVLAKRFVRIGSIDSAKTYGFIDNVCNQLISLSLDGYVKPSDKAVVYLGDDSPLNVNDWAILICEKANLHYPVKVPYFAIKLAALFGDVLKKLGVNFPITSFRLNNMRTKNILDVTIATQANKFPVVSCEAATEKTINWLLESKG
ncbi:NAD-dependent epimerase/dehydratase family protein [Vibrio cidicii]|uniref:NAD-dependent epimerase/dehydratase family protein n=1 Tax=Vibrio cidicii TaxID=1763883 RepID=UPI003F511818